MALPETRLKIDLSALARRSSFIGLIDGNHERL